MALNISQQGHVSVNDQLSISSTVSRLPGKLQQVGKFANAESITSGDQLYTKDIFQA